MYSDSTWLGNGGEGAEKAKRALLEKPGAIVSWYEDENGNGNKDKERSVGRPVLSPSVRSNCVEKILTYWSDFLIGVLNEALRLGKQKEIFAFLEFNGDEDVIDTLLNEDKIKRAVKVHDFFSLCDYYTGNKSVTKETEETVLRKVKEMRSEAPETFGLVVCVRKNDGSLLYLETGAISPVWLYLESRLSYTVERVYEDGETELIDVELSPAQKRLANEGAITYYKTSNGYDIMFKEDSLINTYFKRIIYDMNEVGVFNKIKETGLSVVHIDMKGGFRDLISFYNSYMSDGTTIRFNPVSKYEKEDYYQSFLSQIKDGEIPVVLKLYVPNSDEVLDVFTTTVKLGK